MTLLYKKCPLDNAERQNERESKRQNERESKRKKKESLCDDLRMSIS